MMNRRNFTKAAGTIAIAAGKVALPFVSGGAVIDGIDKFNSAETYVHPVERQIYDWAKSISDKIDSAIVDLSYIPAEETGVIAGGPGFQVPTGIETRNIKYPHPHDAKINLESAMNEYSALSKIIDEKTNIEEILQGVYSSLPDDETITQEKDIFSDQTKDLENAHKQMKQIENIYYSRAYDEEINKKIEALPEIIIGGAGLIYVLKKGMKKLIEY